MDRARVTAITHGGLEYANPLAPGWFDHLGAWAGLTPGERVFDAGCGAGELLISLAERFGTGGTGVDPSPQFIATARERAAARAPDAGLEFLEAEVDAFQTFPESYAMAACIAATHAYGGLRPTLAALAPLVPVGGHVLIGEGFWERDPGPEYLEALGGADADELADLDSTLSAGLEMGLDVVESVVASGQEWEIYESTLVANGRRWLEAHRDDPGAEQVANWVEAARNRRDVVGGRETLGFVAILLRRMR